MSLCWSIHARLVQSADAASAGQKVIHQEGEDEAKAEGRRHIQIGSWRPLSSCESVSLRNGIYQGFDMLTIKSMPWLPWATK